MITFLEKVADDLLDHPPESLLVIFPSRRACQEFRKIYTRKKGRVSRLPVILSISDLPEQLDTTVVADEVTLILLLKEIFDQLYGVESFESFLPFGRQILDDFNEIDRQSIDATQLFEEVRDLKLLDERFGPGSEENEFIKNFWKEFLTPPYTPLQNSFLSYWKQLPELYLSLQKRLTENNIAYEGLMWRQLARSVDQQTYFKKFDIIAFSGFYALNKTEETLLEALKKTGKLKLYIDADELYVNNTFHEAGWFLRKGYLSDVDKWKGNYFDITKESYLVRGCNGRFSIARELALQLSSELLEESTTGTKKSRIVVLADESLLYPFLHHCENLKIPVNASMGFPLKHHPVFKLLQQIKHLKKYTEAELTATIRQRFLEEFYADPVIADTFKKHIDSKDDHQEKVLFNPDLENLLFASGNSIEGEITRLISFLEKLSYGENWMQDVHLHAVQIIRTGISLLSIHQEQLTPSVWWYLLLEYIAEQRVPFFSDQDSGIPVVGFLESRTLDFEVVHIAPLNEGCLPAKAISKSLIPYSIRKAYHMPCKEEQDAVTAYHFYRLLQRASCIRFYYNTNLDANGGGEKSRYLHQIQQEIISRIPPEKTEFSIQESLVVPLEIQPIRIDKNAAVMSRLKQRFCPDPSDSRKRGFSASALNTYISCSLRFYFDQIAGIRPDDTSEALVGGHFGNVLHRCMQLIYDQKKQIQPGDVLEAGKYLDEILHRAVKESYGKPVDSGHDYLMTEVLKQLVYRILQYDRNQAPFEIIGLEDELHISFPISDGNFIGLKGIIDRLDIHEGKLRILDYKTGQDSIQKNNTIEKLFSDPAYKLNFQLMLYCLLVNEYYPDLELPMITGIFRMRQFDDGIEWLEEGNPIPFHDLEDFKLHLSKLIIDIMNPAIPFEQTTETDRCTFCDYRYLCRRATG